MELIFLNNKIQNEAFFKLSYGLFVVSSKKDNKDNGCILNTVMQITDNPKRIMIAINKENFTCNMLAESEIFNISVLSQKADMSLFENFGFKSGKDNDKFSDIDFKSRSENGIYYLTEYSNAYFSAKVIKVIDCGTHLAFLADITEARILNDEPSMTYQYYFDNVKPKPTPKKKGFVCKICGYVYEGETLPPDFICPLCKHPASDFEPIE